MLYVCPCCAMAVANADTSGCESHCAPDHVDRLAQFDGLVSVEYMEEEFYVSWPKPCHGCGDDMLHLFFYVNELA